jgi:predicted ATPase
MTSPTTSPTTGRPAGRARRLVLLGPPGAGKGTQAALLARALGVPAVSTGDIFRANVKEGTELGRAAQRYMDAGEYVPDEVTNRMVADRLAQPDAAGGFLLDGYPRTRAQVEELDAALAAGGVKRVIDFSTSEVYGPFVYRGKESDRMSMGPVGDRRWIYAVSKLAGEHFAHAYRSDYGIDVVTLRPFNIYGPRQVGEGAVQQMVSRALKNEPITVFNDGSQIRSWCYVTDFVDALCGASSLPEASGQTFNVGNPQATVTVLGLAETILRLSGSSSEIVFRPHPGPEVEMRVPDITKATELLGYRPRVGLEEGLRRAIGWYRERMTPAAV